MDFQYLNRPKIGLQIYDSPSCVSSWDFCLQILSGVFTKKDNEEIIQHIEKSTLDTKAERGLMTVSQMLVLNKKEFFTRNMNQKIELSLENFKIQSYLFFFNFLGPASLKR